jgi:hypothetical protein
MPFARMIGAVAGAVRTLMKLCTAAASLALAPAAAVKNG